MAMIEEDYKELNEKLDAILKILNGNGKIGVCAKVNIIWGSGIFLIGTVITQAWILTKILMSG